MRLRHGFVLSILHFVLSSVALIAAEPGGTTADDSRREMATKPSEVIKLFDGESLDGFYTWMKDSQYEDPRQVFRVTDGMLHVTGEGLGGILTKQEYRDYHCVLECKWGEKTWENRVDRTKDSGLLIHAQGADGSYGGIWMPSIEVQIIEGGFGDFILVSGQDTEGKDVPLAVTCEAGRDRDGEVIWQDGHPRERFDENNRKRINWYGRDPDWADEIGFRGREDVESPDGEWTRIDTFAEGGHIRVYVNGVKVNEAFDASPTFGRLQLQTELAEIFIRRWELWPIGKGPGPADADQE